MKTGILFIICTVLISGTHKIHADDTLNIHKICTTQASLCLELLPSELEKLAPRSNTWYKLKMYQLDSLFVLQKVELQRDVLNELPPIEPTPIVFQITAYIHLAKNNYFYQNFDDAQKYTAFAADLINQVNQPFPNPLRLLSLANLQLYDANLKLKADDLKGYKDLTLNVLTTLKLLQAKFNNSFDPIFNRELYANFGHIYHLIHRDSQSLQAYQTALFWTQQSLDQQQIGVAHYNVARAYQRLERYEKAVIEFELARQDAEEAKDETIAQYSYFQLADTYFKLNQLNLVNKNLSQIDKKILDKNLLILVNELESKVSNMAQ